MPLPGAYRLCGLVASHPRLRHPERSVTESKDPGLLQLSHRFQNFFFDLEGTWFVFGRKALACAVKVLHHF